MADKKVTKRQFDKIYGNYLPNRWIKFAFKYFSKETEKKNLSIKNNLAFVLSGLFALGFFGTVFNLNPVIIQIVVIAYSILLSSLVLYLFSAVLLNNRRINKIRKELDISKAEYDRLTRKFYS